MLISPLSYFRQRFPRYQVQNRVEINTSFYSVLFWLFLSSCYIVADFQLLGLGTNFDQIVGIHNNNLDRTGLRICQMFSASCKIIFRWFTKLLFH
jgi:ABC-type enterochelin transport system permease subunit